MTVCHYYVSLQSISGVAFAAMMIFLLIHTSRLTFEARTECAGRVKSCSQDNIAKLLDGPQIQQKNQKTNATTSPKCRSEKA